MISSVAHRIGLGGAELERVPESVLWNVRFPRIVPALLIGASLGCAGALTQGIFTEPAGRAEQPVEVFPHPRTGEVLITPRRGS